MAIDSGEAILSFLPVPDELADRWYFRIFDSFKDLVLCGFQETPRIHSEFSRSLFVCNPFTKQWVALPLAPEIASSSKIGSFVARLVCEPLTCSSNVELDLGEGRPPFVYCSAYRFRVLCIYQMMKSTRVDVFCSESGEWTKEALVLDEHYILLACNGISSLCNSGLLWLCLDAENRGSIPYIIAGFNPFGLDIPPTCINASSLVVSRCKWNISVSQGALHLIVLEAEAPPAPLSIWRLEEHGKSWSIQYKTLLGRTSGRCNYELKECSVVGLHPEKPHIVFLRHEDLGGPWDDVVLSYDSRTEELRYFAEFLGNWAVFHPSVSCWPTPIPRYEKLRVIYDGSYKCWVQQSSSKATPPLPNNW
ncbi:unnamed protein product [Linum tenue]|nr:unnamed protein product [Linum tenue]